MKVGIPTEQREGERRVACVPATVTLLSKAGFSVFIQAGAGLNAHHTDEAYRAAGATVADDLPYPDLDAILSVQPLDAERVRRLPAGAVTVSLLPPANHLDQVRELRDRKITAFSLDLLPRLSRAQAMDALSSQAMVSGYRAVLIAADYLPKLFPMFTTAAGTVAPAKVLVMGAGVAGLQAIATARRLGAMVAAYDVRAAAADEVRSLGARFVELELGTQEGEGGYARAQSEEFLTRQRELIGTEVAAADVVITTAAIPGRQAPILVTAEMVRRMNPGSVIVDLAAESGGNCELTEPGQTIQPYGVTIHGARNLPSSAAVHASQLYARNVANMLLALVRDGRLDPDLDDEMVAGSCLTHDGQVRHPPTKDLLALEIAKEAS
ncbi:Re/Si-specific NAD(P)(+) transhydrogenase subunit alpha [Pseudonocardiaceae bacterium YIM PH 21723]|nr:Re/Si-specific NAD(P)(+) transhydrogenase subunit alpha [Pseudonocardiaceae bacterium YIM PH 21723]